MKSIKKLEKENFNCYNTPEGDGLCTDCRKRLSKIATLKEVLGVIEKEIRYCESKLTGTFQENKIWNWRIDGFKEFIKKIK